jgi:hypothetical protein
MGRGNSDRKKDGGGFVVTDGGADPPRGWLDRIADAVDLGRNEREYGRPAYSPRGLADRVADVVDGKKGLRRRP